MNERTIWIVRIFGIAIFLIMALLLLNLHSKLHRLQSQSPGPATATSATTGGAK